MDPEDIMISEVTQTKTNTIWFNLYVDSEWQSKWKNRKEKKSCTYREQKGDCQRRETWGERNKFPVAK